MLKEYIKKIIYTVVLLTTMLLLFPSFIIFYLLLCYNLTGYLFFNKELELDNTFIPIEWTLRLPDIIINKIYGDCN
jgi:hypothetical protein